MNKFAIYTAPIYWSPVGLLFERAFPPVRQIVKEMRNENTSGQSDV